MITVSSDALQYWCPQLKNVHAPYDITGPQAMHKWAVLTRRKHYRYPCTSPEMPTITQESQETSMRPGIPTVIQNACAQAKWSVLYHILGRGGKRQTPTFLTQHSTYQPIEKRM